MALNTCQRVNDQTAANYSRGPDPLKRAVTHRSKQTEALWSEAAIATDGTF